MATALGARLLARHAAGDATTAQLEDALVRGWITSEEHDAALTTAD